jgi:hypothetical protein
MKSFKLHLLALTVLLGLVVTSAAQERKTRVSGTITDRQGAVVAGAEIYFKQKCECSSCLPKKDCKCCPDQFKVTSDSAGHYEAHVVAGNYEVQVEGTTEDLTVGSTDQELNLKTRGRN